MGRCFAIGVLCLGLCLTTTLVAAAAEAEKADEDAGELAQPAGGPGAQFQPLLTLEEVPSLAAPVGGKSLPAPAAWPVLRHERRLRMLAVIGLQHAAAPFQRIARRCHASLDLILAVDTGGGTPDDITTLAHTNDQWIEAKEKPSVKEVADHAGRVRQEVLASAAGRYDVIFCSQPRPELAAYAEAGGIWVVCGNVESKGPLAALWPATPKPQSTWHHGGAQRTDAIELWGLPLDRLSGHQWHPLYVPLSADSATTEGGRRAGTACQALATGEAGATFVRRIGKGAIVLVPTGPLSRTWDAIGRLQRSYDHDEIWLRFWDQLLHGLAAGDVINALPAMADLRPGRKEALPGKEYALLGRLLNRTKAQQKLAASVHVVSPLGKVVHVGETQEVMLEPGESREWDVKIPVAVDWPTGLYATYLTIGDPVAKKQVHQAMEFVPVTGSVKLDLASDKAGYKLGEKATFTLKASAAAAWQGEVRWAIHDFRGRVLACGALPAELGAEAKEVPFSWTFADHGVRVDTVWATAAAVKDGKEWARAERKVYKHERWDMRNEYQWSVWSGIACQAPCLVPQAMRLLAHAGFNALGYPGRSELFYPAERWSWRMYNEGVGTNTFSPVIESVTDEEIEAAQGHQVQKGADLQSGALVLASVGEEAGFKNGWGHTYYWNQPLAPDKACQAFQRFLKERYPSVETLNAAWGTRYKAWEEIRLTKEFSGRPPQIETDGWAHPKESPLGAGAVGVTLAPFTDTPQFYHWYYDKVIGAALKILREQVNPVPLTMSSAPASWIFVSPRCETRLAGGSGWMESQQWSLSANGQAPGFGLIWGHFDWPVATENMLWGFVLTRSGHNDYWVDVPLLFNPDMTPTRAAWAIRRWRARTAHAERLLLDAIPVVSEAGVLGPSGGFQPQTPGNMANSVKIALNQAGFGFADADLVGRVGNSPHKILFAVFLNSVSRDQAAALASFVESGGTLIFGQRFAGQDQHGVPQKNVPGFGLAETWGLTVTGKNDGIPQYYRADVVSAPLDALGPEFQGLRLDSHKAFLEQVKQSGWTELAAYPDKTPALLTRTLGKGRLVYMNVAYQSQWYIQWVSPTDKARQGFYRVIEKLCADAGAKRTFRIDGNLAETLHMAAVQWSDPSGQIGYAVTRTNGETVWTSGKLTWLGSQTACYDVYGGEPAGPAPAYGKEVALHLRPGAGRLLAFTQAPVRTVKATVTPAEITAGQPLQLKAEILDGAGKAVPGKFPMDIRVISPAGEIAGLRRDLSLASGESMTIQTAHNDPAGRWHVAVRDAISRLQGEATVEVKASVETKNAPGFRPWGWPSEQWEPEPSLQSAFIARLRQLADVYRKDRPDENWLAKQRLGAHYCFFPGTRHDLFRDLADVDWTQHADAIRKAVDAGENLVLVGEDLGLDPATGLRAWPDPVPQSSGLRRGNPGGLPHLDGGRQIEAVTTAMAKAIWEALSGDGEVVRARLGKGSLVLCRTTPDGASSSWGCAAAWHKGLLATLAVAKPAGPIRTPDAARLARWLAGREALLEGARVVTWQGGWEALEGRTPVWKGEWTQALDPARAMPGPVFVLRLPPTGTIKEASVDLAVAGEAPVQIDVGADGSVEAECKAGEAATVPWAEAIGKHLAWRESACGGVERDLNGWRLVPIRFSSPGKVEVAVRKASITVE